MLHFKASASYLYICKLGCLGNLGKKLCKKKLTAHYLYEHGSRTEKKKLFSNFIKKGFWWVKSPEIIFIVK